MKAKKNNNESNNTAAFAKCLKAKWFNAISVASSLHCICATDNIIEMCFWLFYLPVYFHFSIFSICNRKRHYQYQVHFNFVFCLLFFFPSFIIFLHSSLFCIQIHAIVIRIGLKIKIGNIQFRLHRI